MLSCIVICTTNMSILTEKKVRRKCGERWMIRGPVEYIPCTEVTVVDQR